MCRKWYLQIEEEVVVVSEVEAEVLVKLHSSRVVQVAAHITTVEATKMRVTRYVDC